MKTVKISLFFIFVVLLSACTSTDQTKKPEMAKVIPAEEVYFGHKISDPYKYMENLKDSSVQKWIKDQSDYARQVLNSIPGRQGLIDKMVEFDGRRSSTITTLSILDNDLYFYLKTTPADETGKLYLRQGYKGAETLLFDPAKFDPDTTKKYVISAIYPSLDGTKVAFEIAPNGSESAKLMVMDVKDKTLYPERIDRCWNASASWLPDGSGFLYNRLQSSDVHDKNRELDSKVYLHLVGTDPSADKEILSRVKYPELKIIPRDMLYVDYDKDSKYIFAYILTVDSKLNVYYAPYSDLTKDRIPWKHLIKPEDKVYNFATTKSDLYVYTPKNAPNFKVLKTSLAHPDLEHAETVIPENDHKKLTGFTVTADGLYYTLSENGVSASAFFLPKNEKTVRELDLPFKAGTIGLSSKGVDFSDVWFNIMGWSHDFARYRYIPQENKFVYETLSSKAEYPEYNNLTVEELMIPSYDGMMVPLSLIYNKDMKKDGNNPVLIYGYGAYGYSMSPFFSPDFLLWTLHGGILAVAHVRGGGELGEQWHKAGFKTTKPNTWKDLIASAEYLIKGKYTSPQKIAINSASAGGILIGRAMTERPDLFAAAIPQVGCLNPLRAEESPNGPVNVPEFGTVKDSVECMALIKMDSYLHIKDGTKYPATLITAGMNDPRVIAWQPAKFAARLEAANKSDKPILFWADYKAGHGIGNTKTKSFESLADVFSFAFWQTGQPDFQKK